MSEPSPFAAAVAAADLPGAVGLIVDRDGLRHAEAVGLADVERGIAMTVDTPVQIASLTKAIVAVAAMQLVEAGALSLDGDIGELLPELAAPQVLTGFDEAGQPQTRPATRPLTLRHLMDHTSGLGYGFARPELLRWYAATGKGIPGSKAAIGVPLLFDPDEGWEYGVGIDWVGLAIEAASGQSLGAYLGQHLLGPLGMTDTGFHQSLPDRAARVHARKPGGGFAVLPVYLGGGEFEGGGGGLVGTAPDYGRFIRMILRGGELDGTRVLAPGTAAALTRNRIGTRRAGHVGSAMPDLAQPFDLFPDQHCGWSGAFLVNPDPGPHGRSGGSLSWAGIFNCHYWIDPAAGLGGVFMSQLSPFGDTRALAAFAALERMAYA